MKGVSLGGIFPLQIDRGDKSDDFCSAERYILFCNHGVRALFRSLP